MLRIKDKRQKKPATDTQFDQPALLQKQGIEMLIALNLTNKVAATGPDFGIDAKVLITKEKPHFFFNPTVIESEELSSSDNDSKLNISYSNHLGNDKTILIDDLTGEIKQAIDYLHNGDPRKKRTKV